MVQYPAITFRKTHQLQAGMGGRGAGGGEEGRGGVLGGEGEGVGGMEGEES